MIPTADGAVAYSSEVLSSRHCQVVGVCCVEGWRARAGWEDTLSPCSSASTEAWVRRIPVPARDDHGGGALVPRYGSLYRDIEELLGERNIKVAIRHPPPGTRPTPDRGEHRPRSTYPRALDELIPVACHVMEQYANNPIEADHGPLKARLRSMRGLKNPRSARVITTGCAAPAAATSGRCRCRARRLAGDPYRAGALRGGRRLRGSLRNSVPQARRAARATTELLLTV